MTTDLSCLFHLEQDHTAPLDAVLGGQVNYQCLVLDDNRYAWLNRLRTEYPGFRYREDGDWGPVTHRLYVSLPGDLGADDPLLNDAEQHIMRAIVLSRIVRPTPIATGGAWFITRRDNGGVERNSVYKLVIGFYGRAYVSDQHTDNTFSAGDLVHIERLWTAFQRFFDDEPRYRRIARALKFFDGAYHIYVREFKHVVLHAALESLICTGPGNNEAQVTQRLPALVPEISPAEAVAIYKLCCDYKHAAQPLRVYPAPGGVLAAPDLARYQTTTTLERGLRTIFERAIVEPAIADMLADREILKRRLSIVRAPRPRERE